MAIIFTTGDKSQKGGIKWIRSEIRCIKGLTGKPFGINVDMNDLPHRVVDHSWRYGYMKDYAIERMHRDTRILRIYAGTSEVQKMVIAKDVFRYSCSVRPGLPARKCTRPIRPF